MNKRLAKKIFMVACECRHTESQVYVSYKKYRKIMNKKDLNKKTVTNNGCTTYFNIDDLIKDFG